MKISIIGCGKMGSCIAKRVAKDHDVGLYNRNPVKALKLAEEINAKGCKTAAEAVSHGEFIVLAVKPQDLDTIAKEIEGELSEDQLLVSVLAGTTTEKLQKYFPKTPILRIMPNLPIVHGKGVVGLVDQPEVTPEIKAKVEDAFSRLGFLHWIPEKQFDALTALTGSGPAFLFVIVESIIDAGVAMGLSADQSRTLAIELFDGVMTMLHKSEKHPGELKWEVASPGGSTIAGLKTLEDRAVRSGVINTFLAAYQRTQELGLE